MFSCFLYNINLPHALIFLRLIICIIYQFLFLSQFKTIRFQILNIAGTAYKCDIDTIFFSILHLTIPILCDSDTIKKSRFCPITIRYRYIVPALVCASVWRPLESRGCLEDCIQTNPSLNLCEKYGHNVTSLLGKIIIFGDHSQTRESIKQIIKKDRRWPGVGVEGRYDVRKQKKWIAKGRK